MKCVICESSEVRHYCQKNSLEIKRCHVCGHGFVSPIPSQEELIELYGKGQDSLLENGSALKLESLLNDDIAKISTYFSDRVSFIKKFHKVELIRALDFGCASGLFLRALEIAGATEAIGIDIQQDLIQLGESKNRKVIYDGDGSFLQKNTLEFDLISANNVLEHVVDPAFYLRKLLRHLKPSGLIFVSVPNFSSLQVKFLKERSPVIDPPHHIHYFTKDSMAALLNSCGYEVLGTRTVFWGRETDVFLIDRGYRPTTAKLLRFMVQPIKFVIERLGFGGIVQTIAKPKHS